MFCKINDHFFLLQHKILYFLKLKFFHLKLSKKFLFFILFKYFFQLVLLLYLIFFKYSLIGFKDNSFTIFPFGLPICDKIIIFDFFFN